MSARTMMENHGLSALPMSSRLRLIEELHDSIQSEEPGALLDEEFAAGLEDECDEHDRNPGEAISLEQFKKELQGVLDQCHAK